MFSAQGHQCHINELTLTHKCSASVNVIVKCLVLVKINGNNPKKLLNWINEKSKLNIKFLPLI
jgi:hypothetical protein